MEKDWTYILEDSDAKVLVVATEAIYEKVKDYPGKVSELLRSLPSFRLLYLTLLTCFM